MQINFQRLKRLFEAITVLLRDAAVRIQQPCRRVRVPAQPRRRHRKNKRCVNVTEIWSFKNG